MSASVSPSMATSRLKAALRAAGIALAKVESEIGTNGRTVSVVYVRDNDTKTMGLAVHAINKGTSAQQARRVGSSNLIDVEW